MKPATATTVNGLREVDQLVQQINSKANLFSGISQAVYRTRLLHEKHPRTKAGIQARAIVEPELLGG